jgi:hypothetical protein
MVRHLPPDASTRDVHGGGNHSPAKNMVQLHQWQPGGEGGVPGSPKRLQTHIIKRGLDQTAPVVEITGTSRAT